MSPYQVLIVEDDFRVGQINEQFVQQIPGFEVIGVTHTGRDTLRLLRSHTPDLILLDVYIPDVTGMDLFWQIKEQQREVDIIMITASKEVHTVKETLQGGIFDYLIKPIKFERLKDTLQRFNQQKQLLEKEEVEQDDVDQILHQARIETATTSHSHNLPKGVDPMTLEKVKSVVHHRGVTAVEVGKKIGASRTTARRYLEYLVRVKKVKAELIYGDVGRPERRYFLL
ncbi:response regulator [Caldalkalibacillus salinus]|uniref:response regulator n=1 Tax=Caldalkalibacillus salinus TaxID=2803787 RepID=UPI0019214CF8|nr:response regulator [Caldalkalibacillus salinus]